MKQSVTQRRAGAIPAGGYFSGFFYGMGALLTGMKTSMKVFLRAKVTEQYPENRRTLILPERFRGTLSMPHNERNEHKCIACGLCQMACPNDTIEVMSETVDIGGGKKKKMLRAYRYDIGSCMFCQLCVTACPHGAITFDRQFEHAVFDRSKLLMTLNREGSRTETGKED